MGQVPRKKYLLLGDGRLAKHFRHYFKLKDLNFETWSRKDDGIDKLLTRVSQVDVILYAISDDSIQKLHSTLLPKTPKSVMHVHFSGSLSNEMSSFHPLMSFSDELYDIETYEKIHFVCEEDEVGFIDIFPQLNNPFSLISSHEKSLYHALCVMSGNFTVLLWEKLFKDFQKRLNLPARAAIPYLERITQNLAQEGQTLELKSVLTGPLSRRDHSTIASNIDSLEGDLFQDVYISFLKAYDSQLYEQTLKKLPGQRSERH
jgi:predicted short-subunit dehydrogenase-like oxidoreductase (DUF2520 family)